MASPTHGPPSGPPDVEDPRVTVVVASRNRREELLHSLGRHRAPVVLVDNGSSDGTVAAVRERHPWVDVIDLGRNLAAAGRTIGVRRARTPYVAFADDDSWWAPGSLRTAADALESHPRTGAVDVRTLVGLQERLDPFCELLAASPLRSDVPLPGPRILGFMGCAAMLRREAFLAVGGFDDVVRFPGEEERLAWDLTAAGWPLAYLDTAVVHHHPSPLRHGAEQRRRAIARSSALTGVMRLPAGRLAARLRTLVASGGPERLGVLDAVRHLAPALRARRVLPDAVLADLDLLAADEAGSTGAASTRAASTAPVRTTAGDAP
jgi:cellulose synthase/poly-beta-1,6-N-acetylglucosamine synthase-like glycosyltransferase